MGYNELDLSKMCLKVNRSTSYCVKYNAYLDFTATLHSSLHLLSFTL